jgi:ABC-2 type transport system permease protein
MSEPTGRPSLPNIATLLSGQVRYQFRLLMSTPSALIIGVGFPVVLLVTSDARHAHVAVATVAGYSVFGLTMTAFNTHGVRLVAARESGILKRWRATPLPRWCYFLGRLVTVAIFATMVGAITVLVAAAFYGLHLTAAAALGVLITFLLGASAWAAAATVLSSLVPRVEVASPAFIAAYFPVILISGALGQISSEPRWLVDIADCLPAKPLIDAVAGALTHTSGGIALPGKDIAVLAIWAVAGLIAAAATFRWEPRRPAQHRDARTRRQVKTA